MKCLNCGAELRDDIKFCNNCGVEVKKEESNDNNNELGIEKEESVVNNVVGPDIKPIDDTNINNQNTMHNMNDVTNNTNNVNTKKKGSKKPVIITIIVIVLLGLIACLLYLFVFNKKSAKSVFVDGFKKVTSSIFKESDVKKQSVKQSIKYEISGAGMESISGIFNNIVLNNSASIDTDLKKIDEEITINYKNTDLFGFGVYGRDNSIYLGINGLYDKYIKLPITEEEYTSLFGNNNNNSKELKEAIDNAFITSLDDKYFTKSSKTISVDDKNKKLHAYTLTIDNNNIKQITKSFIESLANNDRFVSILGADKNTIKTYINQIDYSNITIDTPIEITIYTEGLKDNYKGIEISMNVEGNMMALRYININKNNSELVMDMGITSLKMGINSVGDENNNKTTATIDMGIMKMSMIMDTIISNNVEFKDIDASQVVDYETFMENGINGVINDVINNISNNEKIIEFITDISSNFGTNYGTTADINNLDYSTLY